ncbi:hypothetical protein TBLA_0E03420 [Henningerozyma blattae CBS 6284]|uniref:ATP-dependent RNA helicase n=1 Tax=Henningerozyma blattae (strain ATCC 34711 / CBS 6284 / DSM 70876 / NBRC 10599 / NRRL Y-10934 / UCD 77-7) TaxID=1071380 RepID=I2H4U4_HENB6|nr:hypothetical protein TBLA_0E03420 [Tetrapisispora blattae CBS 6284]CCH61396.1 hypothetical protein TBLA_0E03420 [Tetrapisispora blattae CBS 6284]
MFLKVKLLKASSLNWKTVKVPDTLDDFGGFYGLEELDGVDIKVVNGQVQFIQLDNTETNEIAKDEPMEEDGENAEVDDEIKDEEEVEEEEEEVRNEKEVENKETKEKSHNTETIYTKQTQSQTSDINESSSNESEYEDAQETVSPTPQEEELETQVFSTNIDIDSEIIPSELPHWCNEIPDLSFHTLETLSRLGFQKPTEIQKKSIPIVMKGTDILGKASTGSGKTLAYGIPIIEKILSNLKEGQLNETSGIIFTPTRELAQQVGRHLNEFVWGDHFNSSSIITITGGLSLQKQERILGYGKGAGQIIVSTPGRFLEIIEKDEKYLERFSKIDILVLDEADRLIQDGHFEEFERILKLLSNKRRELKEQGYWQTLVYSATFSLGLFEKLDKGNKWNKKKLNQEEELDEVVNKLMEKIHFRQKPLVVDIDPFEQMNKQIHETLIECGAMERDLYVYYFLIMYGGSTIVFCNSVNSVKRLHDLLKLLKINSFKLNSNMVQKSRLKSIENFTKASRQNNETVVLIATDVAARGIDIPSIDHVIHYHTPRSADTYIHRSGRAARGSNEGVSVMLTTPDESALSLKKLFAKLDKKQEGIKLLPIDDDILNQLKERVRIASEIVNFERGGMHDRKENDWTKQVADDLGIELDSQDDEESHITEKQSLDKRSNKNKRGYLKQLLNENIRKDHRRSYLTGGLNNLADHVIRKRGHSSIVGQESVDALEQLRQAKTKRRRVGNKKTTKRQP